MKVLILNPPVIGVKFSRDGRCQSEKNTWLETFPPTTLASVAGAVREEHEVTLIDCIGSDFNFEECIDKVQDFSPDFSVINTATPTVDMDMETASAIKEATGSKIIMYGEHISARYKTVLKEYPQLDFAILGEPETPILSVLSGNEEVTGVATLNWDGGLWREPDLDSLPFPAYDMLPVYRFPLTGEKWMFVRSGRGCPHSCIYCVMPLMANRDVRYHSSDYMIRQFKWLAKELDIRLWMLWDELATLDRERMIEICDKLVTEGLHKNCKWFCTTRVDKFDHEIAQHMQQAGCRMISFGIESGDQRVLNKSGKGVTLEQIDNAVKAARDNKIKTIGHLIIGLPGSSDETERKTIDLAKKLKLDFAQFYIATPFPGSKFYQLAKEKGWFVDGDWDKIEQGSVSISYPDFPAERIQYWRRKAYKEFYLRPQVAMSTLSFLTPAQIPKLPFYVKNFFKWMRK